MAARLHGENVTIPVPVGDQERQVEIQKVKIRLWRENERLFLHIRALEGELNGDWRVQVALGKP
jgi:hypothetical protein